MILGFTGSRHGMSEQQRNTVLGLVQRLQPTSVHHGLCVGADEQFHLVVQSFLPQCVINGHPPKNTVLMAKHLITVCDWIYGSEDYLVRDRCIVDSSDVIIATPSTYKPVPHSGTWYTIQYARATCKPTYVVYPDGSVNN